MAGWVVGGSKMVCGILWTTTRARTEWDGIGADAGKGVCRRLGGMSGAVWGREDGLWTGLTDANTASD